MRTQPAGSQQETRNCGSASSAVHVPGTPATGSSPFHGSRSAAENPRGRNKLRSQRSGCISRQKTDCCKSFGVRLQDQETLLLAAQFFLLFFDDRLERGRLDPVLKLAGRNQSLRSAGEMIKGACDFLLPCPSARRERGWG